MQTPATVSHHRATPPPSRFTAIAEPLSFTVPAETAARASFAVGSTTSADACHRPRALVGVGQKCGTEKNVCAPNFFHIFSQKNHSHFVKKNSKIHFFLKETLCAENSFLCLQTWHTWQEKKKAKEHQPRTGGHRSV